jgi:CRISPR-associated protein Cmr4
MFEAQQLVFYSCVSPVHMGAGQAIGVIDNPIQREVHTGHPLIAGSGLKGAVRHHFTRTWKGQRADQPPVRTRAERLRPCRRDRLHRCHAGHLPGALAEKHLRPCHLPERPGTPQAPRRKRCGHGPCRASTKATARLANAAILTDKRLLLEVFDFAGEADAKVTDIAEWLASNALPPGDEHEFFRNKLRNDLVVLSDTEFGHFVRNATVVEAHVRIDDKTGTAADGALFYTENLPPETLLAGLMLASVERRKGPDREDLLDAERVLAAVLHDQGERTGCSTTCCRSAATPPPAAA